MAFLYNPGTGCGCCSTGVCSTGNVCIKAHNFYTGSDWGSAVTYGVFPAGGATFVDISGFRCTTITGTANRFVNGVVTNNEGFAHSYLITYKPCQSIEYDLPFCMTRLKVTATISHHSGCFGGGGLTYSYLLNDGSIASSAGGGQAGASSGSNEVPPQNGTSFYDNLWDDVSFPSPVKYCYSINSSRCPTSACYPGGGNWWAAAYTAGTLSKCVHTDISVSEPSIEMTCNSFQCFDRYYGPISGLCLSLVKPTKCYPNTLTLTTNGAGFWNRWNIKNQTIGFTMLSCPGGNFPDPFYQSDNCLNDNSRLLIYNGGNGLVLGQGVGVNCNGGGLVCPDFNINRPGTCSPGQIAQNYGLLNGANMDNTVCPAINSAVAVDNGALTYVLGGYITE
jgi:hypothetical protein